MESRNLGRTGKARYIGTSSFAAWQIVESLWVSKEYGLNRFVCEQPAYNLLDRRAERELISMAQTYGIAVITWSPTAGGFLDLGWIAEASISEEPGAGKPCAVSRTERIANRVGRSSGHKTPRRTTNLDPKGRGDKSMSVKRGTTEDVYVVALQRLSDMAKATLPEPQCPAVEPHTLR